VTVLGEAITTVSVLPGILAQLQVPDEPQLPLARLVQVAAVAPAAQNSTVRQIITEYLFIAIKLNYQPLEAISQQDTLQNLSKTR